MSRKMKVLVLVLAFALIPSCGDPGVSVEVDGESVRVDADSGFGPSVVIEAEEGRAAVGGAGVPDGFPLPLLGFDVVATSTVQTAEGRLDEVTVEFPADRFESVCDDYERALENLDLEVVRSDSDQGAEGRMMTLVGEGETTSAVINVTHESGTELATASLAWSERS